MNQIFIKNCLEYPEATKKLIGRTLKPCCHKKTWENPSKFWSKQTIELEAKKLVNDIIQALDKVCPEKEHRTKKCSPSWWTIEVHNLRKKLKVAENKWKNMCRNPNAKQRTIQEKYDAYKSIKKEYFKTVKKSKISSQENLLQDVRTYIS